MLFEMEVNSMHWQMEDERMQLTDSMLIYR